MHNSDGADSLELMQGGVDGVVSQATEVAEVAQMPEAVTLRSVSAEDMFGTQSYTVEVAEPTAASIAASQTLVEDAVFQSLAVVMMVLVVSFIARHHRRIATMFVRVFGGRLAEDYSSGRRDEAITRTFLYSASFLGVMLITLFAVKYAPVWLPQSLVPSEGWESVMAVLCVLVAMAAISLYEGVLLWIVGGVTRSAEVVGALRYLKRAGFAMATIALSPIFLLGVLSSENLTDIWNIILVVECVILVFLFLKETLVFFIDKKIPILHWILYLCAAEAFPLSFIWALATRS